MTDPRVIEARKLMIAVTRDEWEKTKEEKQEFINNMICNCGHKHIEHTVHYNINYTGGFCMAENCKCRNFLMAK